MSSTDLSGADLRGADLRGARGVSEETQAQGRDGVEDMVVGRSRTVSWMIARTETISSHRPAQSAGRSRAPR